MKNINYTYVVLGLAVAFGCFTASSAIVRANIELVTETATVAAVVEVSDVVAVDASQTEVSEPATDVVNDIPTDETEVSPDTSGIENAATNVSTEEAVAMDSEVIVDEPTCLSGESAASQLRTMGDIDGNGIINKVDLEILSAHYENSASSESFEVEADINGDGSVNFDDLLTLAQNYGKRLCVLPPNAACEASLSADINKDGVVDMTDLEILSSQYNQDTEGLSGDINADGSVDFDDLLILAQQYNKVVCDMNGGPTNTDDDEDDDNSNSSRRRSSSGRGGDNDGEVLGASTNVCGIYLTGFIFPNRTNSLDDVVRLQLFLRNVEGSTIGTTGFYDSATQAAVHSFQSKYAVDVIKPWSDAGLLPSATESTGNVYLTTQRKINMLACPSLVIPMPELK